MTDQSTMTSSSVPLGRKLPAGSRMTTVEELFGLLPDDQERIEAYVATSLAEPMPGSPRLHGWMPVARLLDARTVGEASLRPAPSGLVLIVRDRT